MLTRSDNTSAFDLHGLLILLLASCWLTGTLLSSWILLPQTRTLVEDGSLIAAALSLGIAGIFWRKPRPRTIGLALLCLSLGMWRYMMVSPAGDTHAISRFIGSSKLEIQGELADEPALEANSTLLTVRVQSVSQDNGQTWQEVDGEISVQMPGSTFDDPYASRYGDTVQLTGKLSAPSGYVTPEILASMAFPSLTITGQNGNALLVALYQLRTNLAGILLQTFPQPYSAVLIAIFLSLHTPSLQLLLSVFSKTGTMHLVASSGFKVTLLAGLISASTRWLVPRPEAQNWPLLPAQRRRGNWKRWLHTLLIVLCIAAYTVLSGAGPAAIRAGIMGALLVLAPRLGRIYNVYTALALAALLMSLADPFVLWDAGFQLSFLGTLSIVLFTPFFLRLLSFLIHLPLVGHQIAEILAVTLAAQVGTAPVTAITFHVISIIAPLANLATVPLLAILLELGGLICLSSLISLQLALLCGWIAWPFLWFVTQAVSRLAQIPWAYLSPGNINPVWVWIYYALLTGTFALMATHWKQAASDEHRQILLPRPIKYSAQCGLALLIILTTSLLAHASQQSKNLTITLLNTGDPAQGQALFLRTPDGQTALINEDSSSIALAQTLDPLLPIWQRSLNLVALSDTSANDLAGLQDIVTRYQIGRVVDGGMLHPSLAYARWRSTLDTRNFPYTQVRQGATIALGNEVSLQVLWPPAQLHKSSDEEHDNALILRLLAPGLRMLLLNSASLSAYALQTLLTSVAPTYLQADIVQICGAAGKAFPAALSTLLTLAHPSVLLLTTIPARKSKKATQPASSVSPPSGPWKVPQSGRTSHLEIESSGYGWKVNYQSF
jgi:competence protein ComEC